MRYIGLIFVVIVLIGVLLWAVAYLGTRNKSQPLESKETAILLARHVDRVLADPTLIGSSEWTREANRLVNDFFKGK